MPRKMDLDALGQKPFPTALAAAGQGGTAIRRRHPLAKSELLFASALGSLVGAFHDWKALSKRARRLAANPPLSTNRIKFVGS
jgi:hypothetical protein